MERNIGKTDQIIRALLGLVLLFVGAVSGSWLGALGLLPLASAVSRICPFYLSLGLSTFDRTLRVVPMTPPSKKNRAHLKKCDL